MNLLFFDGQAKELVSLQTKAGTQVGEMVAKAEVSREKIQELTDYQKALISVQKNPYSCVEGDGREG